MPRRGRKPKKTEAPAPAEEGGADGASSPESETPPAASPEPEEGPPGEDVEAPEQGDKADQTGPAESGASEGGGVAAETEQPATDQGDQVSGETADGEQLEPTGAHCLHVSFDGTRCCELGCPVEDVPAKVAALMVAAHQTTRPIVSPFYAQLQKSRSVREAGQETVTVTLTVEKPDLSDLHRRLGNNAGQNVLVTLGSYSPPPHRDQLDLLAGTGRGETAPTSDEARPATCVLGNVCPIGLIVSSETQEPPEEFYSYARLVLPHAANQVAEFIDHTDKGAPGDWPEIEPGRIGTQLHQQLAKFEAALQAGDLDAAIKAGAHLRNWTVVALEGLEARLAGNADEGEPERDPNLPEGMDAYICSGPEPCCILDQLPEDGNCPACGAVMKPFRYDLQCDKCGALSLSSWDHTQPDHYCEACEGEEEPGRLVERPPAAPEPAAAEEPEGGETEEPDASE